MKENGYRLGIDLGTTFSAVGLAKEGSYSVVPLTDHQRDVPSTVYVAADGTVTVGEAAEALGNQRPTAIAREFKRRLGDPVPLIVDGRPFSPQALMAHVLRWTVGAATDRLGGQPDLITVTCPANWGPYKHELLTQVIRLADVPTAIVCTEPEAAAVRHAGTDAQRTGALVGVYDLGGGTFDAAILQATSTGAFCLKGKPEGIEHLGGMDFDEAIYSFVLQALGQEALDLAGSSDPDVVAAMAAVRRRCVAAKETLSTEPATSIGVSLPGRVTSVRVTRPEFEAMIRPALSDTLRAFTRALREASTTAEQLTATVLVGGSVRIPLVVELVSKTLECQIVMPRDPSHSVALGAAMVADRYRMPNARGGDGRVAPKASQESPKPAPAQIPHRRQPARSAVVSARELVRLDQRERATLVDWLVEPGAVVRVGQPLAKIAVRAPMSVRPRTGQASAVLLRSPFDGVLHRTFIAPGDTVSPSDLLAGFEQVGAYLARPSRVLPSDTGIRLSISRPVSATAVSGRPVVFVDRVPRLVWWSAGFCVLTDPGEHLVGAAYVRGNQWFGFVSRTVQVGENGMIDLVYTDPGAGATAELRLGPTRTESTAGALAASGKGGPALAGG